MVTRILHISDLHFPSRDKTVAQLLHETILEKRPNFVVITGDLVDHPWPPSWNQVRAWLRGLEAVFARKQQPKPRILAQPGNHDVFVYGTGGWRWPANLLFNWKFREWRQNQVLHVDNGGVTFLRLDSNPRIALYKGSEGKTLRGRLNNLRREWETHPKAAAIRASTKVLLMHHHPLPVPFEGEDYLLHTRRSDLLLRFLAENQIGLVLHGHKHRASWSHLRVGGTNGVPFLIELVGAGSAMKSSDIDPRGHNFNLIDIAPNGTRQVRQFFKERGGGGFEEKTPSRAEERFGQVIQTEFRQAYRMERLVWRLRSDEEGDTESTVFLQGVVFNRVGQRYQIRLPEYTVDQGEATDFQMNNAGPPQLGANLEKNTWTFDVQPTAETPATVEASAWLLNFFVMNLREAAELGPVGDGRGSMEHALTEAVGELCLEAEFPQGFVLGRDSLRLEVLEPIDGETVVHQALTSKFRGVLANALPAANRLSVAFENPPPNFRYRLSWAIPEVPPDQQDDPPTRARQRIFEKKYLELRNDVIHGSEREREELVDAVRAAFKFLFDEVEKKIRGAVGATDAVLDPAATAFTFMVCDRATETPRLRPVLWSEFRRFGDFFKTFELPIGGGNAGRAYKTGSVRLYDREAALNDPKGGTYKQFKDGPQHEFLISVPILDPASGLPLAVISMGTESAHEAALLRALSDAAREEVADAMQKEPLTSVLNAASLDRLPV